MKDFSSRDCPLALKLVSVLTITTPPPCCQRPLPPRHHAAFALPPQDNRAATAPPLRQYRAATATALPRHSHYAATVQPQEAESPTSHTHTLAQVLSWEDCAKAVVELLTQG